MISRRVNQSGSRSCSETRLANSSSWPITTCNSDSWTSWSASRFRSSSNLESRHDPRFELGLIKQALLVRINQAGYALFYLIDQLGHLIDPSCPVRLGLVASAFVLVLDTVWLREEATN